VCEEPRSGFCGKRAFLALLVVAALDVAFVVIVREQGVTSSAIVVDQLDPCARWNPFPDLPQNLKAQDPFFDLVLGPSIFFQAQGPAVRKGRIDTLKGLGPWADLEGQGRRRVRLLVTDGKSDDPPIRAQTHLGGGYRGT